MSGAPKQEPLSPEAVAFLKDLREFRNTLARDGFDCTHPVTLVLNEAAKRFDAHRVNAHASLVAALRLDKQIEDFDCPHDAEHRCRCGAVQDEMIARYREMRERLLKGESRD